MKQKKRRRKQPPAAPVKPSRPERQPLNRQQLRWVTALAAGLFCLGLVIPIVMAILQDRGWSGTVFTLVGLAGMFGSLIACIALLLTHLVDYAMADVTAAEGKYARVPLSPLHRADAETVRQVLTDRGFSWTDPTHCNRKKFSFLKDSIHYYAALRETANVIDAVSAEEKKFEAIAKPGKNCCLLLFLYMDHPTEPDGKSLRYLAKTNIVLESIVPQNDAHNFVPVLVDKSSGQAQYLDIGGRFGISNYAHGCRLLRSYFL